MRIIRQFCNTCLQVLSLQLEKQLEMKHKDDCLKKKQIGLLTLLSWQCEQIQCVTNKKKIFFCCCCCSSSSKERVLKTEIHGDVSTLRNVGNINFYFILNRHFLKIKNAFLYVGNLIIQSCQSILLQFFCNFGHKSQSLRNSFSNRKVKTFQT